MTAPPPTTTSPHGCSLSPPPGALPPLVPPAPPPPDSASWHERYARHLRLPDIGPTGQGRLAGARVAVVGAGGLGSPVLMYLAAAGVGELRIIDDDLVDASNLQRQVVHAVSSPGTPKVQSVLAPLSGLAPFASLTPRRARLGEGTAAELIDGCDLVIDCTDTFASRYAVSDACTARGLPCVWGSVLQFEGQASVFWSDPPVGAPLTYRDAFPVPPPPELAISGAMGGIMGAICGVIGSMMALEAIKLITGVGTPLLGTLVVYDGLRATMTSVPARRGTPRGAQA